MTNHPGYEKVVAAFVDGESVDAEQLRDALALPEGRDHLLDLVALRQLVLTEPVAVAPSSATARRSRATVWRALAMAAALLLAIAGGYLFGRAVSPNGTTVVQAPQGSDAPPKPTVVITVERWQDMQKGGGS